MTYIANNIGEPGLGGGRLLRNGQIKKAIGSYFTSNREVVEAAQSGAIAFELMPQGSMAEAIRAGGAGIGGFYTPTAAGTVIAADAETKLIDGLRQVFVPALRADVALIRAWQADSAGNLVYRRTEQNFNKAMATAADLVIAEAEEILPVGSIDPDHIHTPGSFIDVLVQASTTLADLGSSADIRASGKQVDAARMRIARRAFAELRTGDVVNLGIGIPTLIADLIISRARHYLAYGKWDAGCGSSAGKWRRHGLSGQRRQDTGDRVARQQLLRQCRFLRHDPRRTY